MMYQFNKGAATFPDGSDFGTQTNSELSAQDKVVANMLYPKQVASLPESELIPDAPAKDGAIQSAGQVATYRFLPQAGVGYTVATESSIPLLVSATRSTTNPAGHMFVVDGPGNSLQFQVTNSEPYFIQVRHGAPMSGTGTFKISVVSGG